MYAIENKDVPQFRRFMEDMYYSNAPSKFPIYTAYCEVIMLINMDHNNWTTLCLFCISCKKQLDH